MKCGYYGGLSDLNDVSQMSYLRNILNCRVVLINISIEKRLCVDLGHERDGGNRFLSSFLTKIGYFSWRLGGYIIMYQAIVHSDGVVSGD